MSDALEIGPSGREAFLARACVDDAALRREVEYLLQAHEAAGTFIEEPPASLAAALLAENGDGILQTGEKLSHYRVVDKLGQGGMGEVYLAEDERLARKVALKLLPAAHAKNSQRLRRFSQEARAVSALNHPNILTIFDLGEERGKAFLVTEYVAGQTLQEVLKDGPLAPGRAVRIAAQVTDALRAAHAAGIIHRDIKPANIMVRADGYVKVLDFGLAKLTADSAAAAPSGLMSTKTGAVMGTASYMSPEQARGQEIDGRSDIFNVGIILYEMLVGARPFTGENNGDIIAAIIRDEPRPLPADTPPALAALVMQALRKDMAGRYPDAGAMCEDLEFIGAELAHETHESAPGHLHVPLLDGPAPTRRRRINQVARAGVLALLLLILPLAVYFFYYRNAPATIDSVAVLPFDNQTNDPNAEYLAEGLADGLINSLSQLSGVRVMSLNTVSRYQGQQADAQKAGRELNVEAVLVGRLARRGEDLIVSAELVEVSTGGRLWGQEFRRKLSEAMSVRSEIAANISVQLRHAITGAEQQRLEKRYTANGEAERIYAQGRSQWNKRTGESLQRGIAFFRQAIALDPAYAQAYAGLADCYTLLPNYTSVPAGEVLPEAKVAALKAVELDATLAEAHAALGLVRKDYDLDFAGAEESFAQALALNPSYAAVYQRRAENLVNLRRLDEAVATMKQARELDPLSLIINAEVGWAYYHAGRPAEAVADLQKTLTLDADFARTHFYLSRAYEQKRDYPQALAAGMRAVQLSDSAILLASLGHVHANAGQTDKARAILTRLQQSARAKEYVPPMAFALLYTGLGDKDAAFSYLNRAFDERDTILSYYLYDPQLASLRDDPRFVLLTSRFVG